MLLSAGLFATSVSVAKVLLQRRSGHVTHPKDTGVPKSLIGSNIIIAIDIGSSSVRCSAFRVDAVSNEAVLVPECTANHTGVNVTKGVADCNALFAIVNLVVKRCLTSLQARGATAVSSVGITSFAMTLVGLNAQTCVPETPMFTYAGQGLSVNAAAEEILRTVSSSKRNEHYARTGTVMHHPCYATAQLKSYFSQAPQGNSVPKPPLHWTTLSGYILGQWTGLGVGAPISLSDAAWTGMLNRDSLQWDDKALRYLGLEVGHFAALAVGDGALHGGLGLYIPGLTAEEGTLLDQTSAFAGIGDGLAATLGSKCRWSEQVPPSSSACRGSDDCDVEQRKPIQPTAKRNVSVTIGTSAAARFISSFECDPVPSPSNISSPQHATASSGLFMYRTSKHEALIGGAITDAGSLVAWFSDLVGKDRLTVLMTEIRNVYSSGDISEFITAPLVLPFWSGERSTGWRHDSRGAITGITLQTSPRQLLVSLMDGVMMRLLEIILQLNEVARNGAELQTQDCCSIEAIVGSGAVLEKWWVWRQMLADVTNLPVLVLREKNGETTLNGLAVHIISCQQGNQTMQQDKEFGEEESRNLIFGFEKEDIEEVNFPIERNYRSYQERFQDMKELYKTFHSMNE